MGDKSPKAKDKAKHQHTADVDAKKKAAEQKKPAPSSAPPAKKGK